MQKEGLVVSSKFLMCNRSLQMLGVASLSYLKFIRAHLQW